MSDISLETFDSFIPDEATELRALERALVFGEGFKLLLVRCNPGERRRLSVSLCKRLTQLNIQRVEFDKPVGNLLDELRGQISGDMPDALFVSGLENSFSHTANPRQLPLIANLNAGRNSFPRLIECPLVLWVSQYVLDAIAQGAPDFFSIRSGVYFFAASSQTMKSLFQSLTSGEAWVIDSLPVAEKLERIDAIQSLLSDYQSLPLDQRDIDTEMSLFIRLGNILTTLGRFPESIRFKEKALEIARSMGDIVNEGVTLANLGNAYAQSGEAQQAISYYEKALEIADSVGDLHGQGNALVNLGTAYLELGETSLALDSHKKALEIARSIADVRMEGTALSNMGNVYLDSEEIDKAIDCYEKAMENARSIGNMNSEGIILGNIGAAYMALGERKRAIEYFNEALKIARTLGNRRVENIALENLRRANDATE